VKNLAAYKYIVHSDLLRVMEENGFHERVTQGTCTERTGSL